MAEILHQSINFDIACSITAPQCRCEESLFEGFFFLGGGRGGRGRGDGCDIGQIVLLAKAPTYGRSCCQG